MNKFKFYVLFVFILVFFQNCNDDFLENERISEQIEDKKIESLSLNRNDQLKLKFGRAFGNALKDNPELRKLIKEEALKMFNKDYDVMYHLIKDKHVGSVYRSSTESSSYSSVRGILLEYFEDESELLEIEQQLPLLTVFVPKLPEDSFSAENWDTEDEYQTPVVAIRIETSNEVPMIDALNNYEYVLEEDLIPSYPVVVIKNNERLVVNTENHNFLRSTNLIEVSNEISYRFIDDNFDNFTDPVFTNNDNIWAGGGSYNGGGTSSGGSGCTWNALHVPGRQNSVDQFLKNAYNIFEGQISSPWHRDNIYYQLTPTQTTNTYVGGKYREAITYFTLKGSNPQAVFNHLANQSGTNSPDPQMINQFWSNSKLTGWTDGQFEIGVNLRHYDKTAEFKNTPLAFPARADQLFTIGYETRRVRRGFLIRWWRTYFKPYVNGYKAMNLLPNNSNSEDCVFIPWDLDIFANKWDYSFQEIDITQEVETSSFYQIKRNSNIELSLNPVSEKIKVGLKFGSSIEETDQNTYKTKWIIMSNNLGSTSVFFYDQVLNKNPCNNLLYPKMYSLPNVNFEVRPVQVEW